MYLRDPRPQIDDGTYDTKHSTSSTGNFNLFVVVCYVGYHTQYVANL